MTRMTKLRAGLGTPSLAALSFAALSLAGLLAGGLCLGPAAPAQAGNAYKALFAFGDSLSDVGNYYAISNGTTPPSPPYSLGRYSNGPVWVQTLASSLGVRPLSASVKGGTVYATGGATASGHRVADLAGQFQQYTAVNGTVASGTALFTVAIGVNDLQEAVNAGANSTALMATATQAVTDTMSVVAQLLAMGARHIIVTTPPDVTRTPSSANMSPPQLAALAAGLRTFVSTLNAQVAALQLPAGAKVSVLDIYTLLDSVIAQPASMGFTNVNNACLTYMAGPPATLMQCATSKAGQDQYLWWDIKHPTEHGHQAIAAQALLQLP